MADEALGRSRLSRHESDTSGGSLCEGRPDLGEVCEQQDLPRKELGTNERSGTLF